MRRTTEAGFTILECVIAAFVLVAGFMAVAAVFPQSNKEATLTRNHQTAMALANSILDAIAGNYQIAPHNIYNSTLLNAYSVTEMVEGTPVTTTFVPTVTFTSGRTDTEGPCQNGAVNPAPPADVAKVTITWHEGSSEAHGGNTTKTLFLQGGVGIAP